MQVVDCPGRGRAARRQGASAIAAARHYAVCLQTGIFGDARDLAARNCPDGHLRVCRALNIVAIAPRIPDHAKFGLLTLVGTINKAHVGKAVDAMLVLHTLLPSQGLHRARRERPYPHCMLKRMCFVKSSRVRLVNGRSLQLCQGECQLLQTDAFCDLPPTSTNLLSAIKKQCRLVNACNKGRRSGELTRCPDCRPPCGLVAYVRLGQCSKVQGPTLTGIGTLSKVARILHHSLCGCPHVFSRRAAHQNPN